METTTENGTKAKGSQRQVDALVSTQTRFYDILIAHLGVDREQITHESTPDDLGADSLDLLEIVMGCEKEFNIMIPDEDAEKMSTVGDCLKYLDKRLSG